ncbi:MAG: tyrosine-type recombinase/integrase [Candidatus Methylomirabilales bacterium]
MRRRGRFRPERRAWLERSEPGHSSIRSCPPASAPPRWRRSGSGIASWATARPRWWSARVRGARLGRVFIPQELKAHLKAFLTWKREHGEDVSDEAPVFTGQRGPLTRNGVWRIVKGLMRAVGLDPRYATHSCRHSYATHLYRASGNDLEVVQEQLGHASIKTTTIYAKVTKEDKLRAANALAKAYHDSQRNIQSGASWPRRRPPSADATAQSVASS